MVAARNEEKVIGNLLDSIAKQDYPKELITTFVVADNCTDKTAKIARKFGAVCYERFKVSSIEYNADREISALSIVNEKGKVAYELKESFSVSEDKSNYTKKPSLSHEQITSLQSELMRTGIPMEAVKNRYKIQEPECMSTEMYGKVMTALKKTKTAA